MYHYISCTTTSGRTLHITVAPDMMPSFRESVIPFMTAPLCQERTYPGSPDRGILIRFFQAGGSMPCHLFVIHDFADLVCFIADYFPLL